MKKRALMLGVLCLILISAFVYAEKTILVSDDPAVLYFELGKHEFKKGNLDAAHHAFSNAVALNADYAEAHHNLGVVAHAQGNIAEAQQHFENAVEADPRYAKGHYSLSVVAFHNGNHEQAVEHLTVVIEQEPSNENALFDLAINHVELFRENEVESNIHHLEKGLETYDQLLELNPNFPHAQGNRAIVESVLNEYS